MERTWLSWEWRLRWRSIVVLALLVALSTAAVGVAFAGAGRAESTLRRMSAATNPATLNVLPNDPEMDWGPVRRLPEVESLATYSVSDVAFVDGRPDELWMSPDSFEGVERPVVVDGRLPDPTAADEVVVSSRFPTRTGKGVGDRLTISLFERDSVAAAMGEAMSTGVTPEPDGPDVEVTIVGVVRSYWSTLIDNDYAAYFPNGAVMYGPGFGTTYGEELVGDPEATHPYRNALVRLRNGDADIASFTKGFAELTGRPDVDMWVMSQRHAALQSSIDFEAWTLRVFAVVAAMTSIVLVGQAASRMAGTGTSDLGAFVGAGLSRSRRARLASLGVLAGASVGAGIGAVAAVALTQLLPIGTAAIYEPAPGDAYGWSTAVVVGAAAILASAAIGFVGGWIAAAPAVHGNADPSVSAATAARLGVPVPGVVGVRFALDRGTAPQSLAVRPTLIAVIVGVAGLVATVAFARSLDRAATDPTAWGETWDGIVAVSGGGAAMVEDIAGFVAAANAAPAVDAAALTKAAIARRGTEAVTVLSLDPAVASRIAIVEGRAPHGTGEIVVGPTVLDSWGLAVGDRVDLSGPAGRTTSLIVGTGFTPTGSHNSYDDSAWIGAEGFDQLFGGRLTDAKEGAVLVWARPGAVSAAIEEVAEVSRGFTPDGTPIAAVGSQTPGKVIALRRIGALPVALGGFLVVLGVGAVAHALVSAINKRRGELAVLRVLGQTPAQTGVVAFAQAGTIALVGLAFGLPGGVALGRWLWRVVARSTPVVAIDPDIGPAVLLALPVTLVAMTLLAVWPSRRAGRIDVVPALRAD